MRTKSFILLCGLLVAMLFAAGAVYAYDASREDLIADGVHVGGVDLGGLRADQAKERLRAELFAPLSQPVVVKHGLKNFTLTAEEARITVDLEGSVRAAVERSRRGDILSRTYRGITDAEVRAELPVDIRFDQAAVDRLVQTIRRQVERKPVDADVDLSGGRVDPRPSREGVAVRVNELRRDVSSRLIALNGSREVALQTRRLVPDVTTDELGERYPAILIVNRNQFRLTLYRNLRPAKTYRIAVGQAGMDTPAGLYNIQNKAENPVWHVPDSEWAGELRGKKIPPDDPRNPIEARWMGIYDGAGIHGTEAVNSLGTRASHGCIRMAIPDVIELYDKVPVQAPVYII